MNIHARIYENVYRNKRKNTKYSYT